MLLVQLSPDEQKQVLGKRRGNTLSRRSILKSYHPTTKKQHNAMHIDGVSELRQAKGMPVYTMGTADLRGLRRSLSSCNTPSPHGITCMSALLSCLAVPCPLTLH